MTITDNRKNTTAKFSDIYVGEVFYSPETDHFYIRIETIYSHYEEQYDAVELSDGYLVCFDDDEMVERVTANITITNA